MKKRFSEQYNILGLEVPKKDMDAREKAEAIFYCACKILGLSTTILPGVLGLDDEFQPSLVAFYKLQVIRKAIVGKWIANWNDRSRKWSPFHWMDSPGFRFVVSGCVISDSGTTGSSRLCLETEEQSDFVGIECIAFYADIHGAELPTAAAA